MLTNASGYQDLYRAIRERYGGSEIGGLAG